MVELTEEQLDKLAESEYAEDLKKAITGNNTTVDIIIKAVLAARSFEVIKLALESPLLNDEIFRAIYSRVKNSSNYVKEIITSPFCTREMYDQLLKYLNKYNIECFVNSPLATEDDYIKILDSASTQDTTYRENNLPSYIAAIIKGHALTQNVISKILEKRLTSDQLIELMNISFVDGDLFRDVLIKFIARGNYDTKAILEHPKMTKKILSDILLNTNLGIYSAHVGLILQSSLCDDDIMSKLNIESDDHFELVFANPNLGRKTLESLIDEYKNARYSDENIMKLINHPLMDETLLELLVDALNEIPGYRRLSNGTYSNIDKLSLIKAILASPVCSEKVVMSIARQFSNSSEIYDLLKGQSINVQKALYLNEQALSNIEKIEEYLSLPGLTIDDMIEGLKYGNAQYARKLAELDINDIKLNDAVVIYLCKNWDNSYNQSLSLISKQFLDKDKDLSEETLQTIIESFSRYDSDVIFKVLDNANAKMKVEKAARNAADKMRSEQLRNSINEEADKLHKRIISGIYNIEEEKDATEQLRRNVEDGRSTMIWGPSGIGKTDRVREIDPTVTMIVLKDGMLPEEVVGGKEPNGEPGEVYPPHWYKVLCRKCEEEPDRQHILFFDEFTNVKENIKTLVWDIIGARQISDHEEWRLPDNCTVVVAGNRPEESTSVRLDNIGGVMSAPLHNRMMQMLEIKFDIDEWQRWALGTNPKTGNLKIHPVVYSFCVAHADSVMFTPFDPNNITEQFLTPRKWESLSNLIYAAEKRGGPLNHPSYERIYGAIGHNDIARAFIAHYERIPIDMNKIIMGEYNEEDFPGVEDKLYALGSIIANYNGDEIAVETFINDCLGDEYMSIYQTMKEARNDALEKISQKENMMRM